MLINRQLTYRISLVLMIVLYLAAGINHFRNPEAYYPIIPPYIGHVQLVNILAGLAEIVLAIGLLLPITRKWAAYGIVLLLLAFVPTHVYMLQQGGCFPPPSICLPMWTMWLRLLVFQPLLIWWAYTVVPRTA